jgi:hypothetical protein
MSIHIAPIVIIAEKAIRIINRERPTVVKCEDFMKTKPNIEHTNVIEDNTKIDISTHFEE